MPDTESQCNTNLPVFSVLYVDDEPDLLEITRLFLEQSGEFRVGTMTSAEEALNSQIIPSYDAIVSDYLMPGMDGIDFLKTVRKQFGDIPFILFTGRGREEVVIDAINNGADFYLQKGGDPQAQFAELAQKIRNAVRRKQAEGSLYDSEKRLSDIIDFLPDATFAINRSGEVIAWNLAIEEMTGVFTSDILGKGNFEYAVPFYGSRRPALIDLIDESDEKIAQYYSNINRTGNSITAETDLPHPKGNRISVLTKVCRLYNRAGEITGAIESIRNITEEKRVDDALRESEEQFRGMAERSTDLIFILDKGMNLTYVSPCARSVIGYDPKELLGSSPEFIATTIFTQSANEYLNALQANMKGESIENVEMQVQKKDGCAVYVNVHAIPIMHDGIFSGAQISMRDITADKKAERALRDTEEKYHLLAGNVHDVIWTADTKMRMTYISPSVLQLRGLTQKEALEETLEDSLTKESYTTIMMNRRRGLEALQKDRAIPYSQVMELEFIRKDGSTVWTEVVINPAFDLNKKLVGVIGVIRDISLRRHAEQALRKSEEKFRLTLDATNDGLWDWDIPSGTAFFSPRYYTMLGYEPGEFPATFEGWKSLIHPDDLDHVVPDLLHQIQEKMDFLSKEFRIRSKNGDWIWIQERGKPVTYDDKGNVVRVIGTNTDITERKKAEKALRESEERYRKLVHNVPDYILVHRNGKILFVNKTAATTLGYTPEELIGTHLLRYITQESQGVVAENMQKRFISEKIPSYEITILTREGVRKIVEVNGVLIQFEGGPASLNVLTDITERKQSLEALRESNQKLRLLTGLTRHDIFNQISTVELLQNLALNSSDLAKIHEYISSAQEADNRIEAIIGFTREYEDFGIVSSGWQDIFAIVESAKAEIYSGIIILDNQIPPDIEVYADPIIRKVFTTLMDNASRHGKEISQIRFSCCELQDALVITCEDDGIGIREEEKERIFDNGYGSHTGIGLFLAREILSITGLSIKECGKEGIGAKFEICVPAGKFRRTG